LEFVRFAREELNAFGKDSWSADRWQQGKTVAVFATQLEELTPYRYTPLAHPFKDFAKAYVRYKYSHRPVVSVQYWLQALRCIEASLIESTMSADILRLNVAVMDLSAQKCREFYLSEDVHHKTGLSLATVFEFCRDNFVSLDLPEWRSPFRKPTILTEDLGDAGREHRESKLPSNAAMLALAELFSGASDAHTKYYASIAILLMATPSRISEVLALSVNCIGYEVDDHGQRRMFLRWRALKGKGDIKKWVMPVMEDVVVEAVRRLDEIGIPARLAARQAFDSSAEVPPAIRGKIEGSFWPFIDANRSVKVWDALCLHREFEFHAGFAPREDSWRLPAVNEVNARFNPGKGVYLLAGMRDADGRAIKLTTHQPRHWLSTMSERAGMDDYTLAQWAGRARVADNRHYDHRSAGERLEEARALIIGERPSLLDRFKGRQPVTFQELGIDRLGTAIATLYGICTHDYAMAPCMKQRECMTCKEHRCIKGDHVTLERIILLEAQTQRLLDLAQRAHDDGEFGADRWVDNHKWKLANVRTMRILLEQNSLPDGTVLGIPDGHDPSPVLRALIELGLVEAPDGFPAPRAIPIFSV
jgi:hypothetical protein